jgi:hypothetical protein
MDWRDLDPTDLFETIRAQAAPPDAEPMVWAFGQVFAAARADPALLDHLAAAAVCAVAYRDRDTPRGVAEKLFRRAVSDERWQRDYEPLLPAPRP